MSDIGRLSSSFKVDPMMLGYLLLYYATRSKRGAYDSSFRLVLKNNFVQ